MPPRTPRPPKHPRAPLTLLTLGTLGFEGSGAEAASTLLRQPKRVAVLAYLLLNQRSGCVSRDRLMAIFWPEADSARARNALRQTLSFLRGALGDAAIVSHGSASVSVADGVVECDALQFERHLEDGEREQALALARGEFLPSFHVQGSVECDEWIESRRRYFHERTAKAAWDLADTFDALGKYPEAAFWGKRAFALSPFSESELQRLIRLLDRVGDYAGALRAAQGLEQHLAKEFNSRPSRDTLVLIELVRRRGQASGEIPPVHLNTRRVLADRRTRPERRRSTSRPWIHAERRKASRRRGERRSGTDRRGVS